MNILVLGVTGMLGNTVFRYCFNERPSQVWGTLRNPSGLGYFPNNMHDYMLSNIDVMDHDSLMSVFMKVRPDVVINCIGVIKQLSQSVDPLYVLPINSILPHRLANLCQISNARLIHLSTDCVFSGNKGMYVEGDVAEPCDLYGMSKYIGEISGKQNVVTIRTSIIGHELYSKIALVEWFLSQESRVSGYTKAIYSGFPTIELAKIIMEHVIPNYKLNGMYHVSSEPIDKYSLLSLIAEIYKKDIEIIKDGSVRIDRSLDSSHFRSKTGYFPPSWRDMVKAMHDFR